jgi:glycosyltransferase involved in cell wall biosynthesis
VPDPRTIAFVSPRFAEGPTVGGAETLLKTQARYAIENGLNVTFLTTCAQNHHTWENEVSPGARVIDGIPVEYFPVNENRNIETFHAVQQRISRGLNVTRSEEETWIQNSVNSVALCEHLRKAGEHYDRIVVGPYLYGLCYEVSQLFPGKTVFVPCLHDEPFAYVKILRPMFDSHVIMFNSFSERDLARRLFGDAMASMPVVGMGLEPYETDPSAIRRELGFDSPYLLYSGRREPLKGTPLLCAYINAFRERTQRDVKLVLTGTGHVEAPPALMPHMYDLGFVSEQKKHDAMSGALAFCHPSVNESFGIVALEAWLAGTPCLVHACSDVLRHHCRESNGGLWFRYYGEFEEQLLMLLDHCDLAAALAKSGMRYVQDNYTHAAVSDKMMQALRA